MSRHLARLGLPAFLVPLAIGLAACSGQAAPVGQPLARPVVNQPPVGQPSPVSPVGQPTPVSPVGQPTPQPDGTPKAQFITAADQICGQSRQQINSLGNPDQNDPQAVADYLRQGAQIEQAGVNQIAALGFPPADSALLTDLMNRSRADLDAVGQAADQFATGDVAGGNQTLESVRSQEDSVSSQLRSYGFQVCGQG
jgi:hypothetical protein